MSTFKFTVTEGIGQPLNDWLADRLPDVSADRIHHLIATSCVRINGQPCCDKEYRLQWGDRLCLKFPPAPPVVWQPETIPLEILYEDAVLIIVNKPAGMALHPSPGHRHGTLANALLAHTDTWPLAGAPAQRRPGIVHRLDRETSGAIALAKTQAAIAPLQAQFKTKVAHRVYLGLVQGIPATASGLCDQPIGPHPSDRHRYAIVPEGLGGRFALTHWQIEALGGDQTLLRFTLDTGRSHQIRVHCAAMGHPLVGDTRYGGPPSDRLWLHSWELQLQHPRSGESVRAIAPIHPESLFRM